MTEFVIVKVGDADVTGDTWDFLPVLAAYGSDGTAVFAAKCGLSRSAVVESAQRLRLGDDLEPLKRLLLRWAIRRIESALTTPDEVERLRHDGHTDWVLSSYDVDDLLQPGLAKHCDYQRADGRDLFCVAAAPSDPTIMATIDGRAAAPTSRALCTRCELPDSDYLCSHFLHPQVHGIVAGAGGIVQRAAGLAVCDRGRDEISQWSGCQPAGHECWERIVYPQPVTNIAVPSPLTLPEAIDFLDAVWRLAFDRRPLLVLRTASDTASLALDCTDREGFESRVVDLADVIDNLHVDDDLITTELSDSDRQGSLNRLEFVVASRLADDDDQGLLRQAVGTLRRVRRVRHSFGHSGAATELPRSLADLGIPYPPDWPVAWDSLRSRTAQALSTIRDVVRRIADT